MELTPNLGTATDRLRPLDTAPETANTALAVAQELWEVQKSLGDGRQVKFDRRPDLTMGGGHHGLAPSRGCRTKRKRPSAMAWRGSRSSGRRATALPGLHHR